MKKQNYNITIKVAKYVCRSVKPKQILEFLKSADYDFCSGDEYVFEILRVFKGIPGFTNLGFSFQEKFVLMWYSKHKYDIIDEDTRERFHKKCSKEEFIQKFWDLYDTVEGSMDFRVALYLAKNYPPPEAQHRDLRHLNLLISLGWWLSGCGTKEFFLTGKKVGEYLYKDESTGRSGIRALITYGIFKRIKRGSAGEGSIFQYTGHLPKEEIGRLQEEVAESKRLLAAQSRRGKNQQKIEQSNTTQNKLHLQSAVDGLRERTSSGDRQSA